MLPLNERLRQRVHFEAVYRRGRAFNGPSIRLIVMKAPENSTLAGFIVSKKVSKKAVLRNQVKRRLRSIYAQFSQVRNAGVWVLFIARPSILNRNYDEIHQEVNQLIKKAGLGDK